MTIEANILDILQENKIACEVSIETKNGHCLSHQNLRVKRN